MWEIFAQLPLPALSTFRRLVFIGVVGCFISYLTIFRAIYFDFTPVQNNCKAYSLEQPIVNEISTRILATFLPFLNFDSYSTHPLQDECQNTLLTYNEKYSVEAQQWVNEDDFFGMWFAHGTWFPPTLFGTTNSKNQTTATTEDTPIIIPSMGDLDLRTIHRLATIAIESKHTYSISSGIEPSINHYLTLLSQTFFNYNKPTLSAYFAPFLLLQQQQQQQQFDEYPTFINKELLWEKVPIEKYKQLNPHGEYVQWLSEYTTPYYLAHNEMLIETEQTVLIPRHGNITIKLEDIKQHMLQLQHKINPTQHVLPILDYLEYFAELQKYTEFLPITVNITIDFKPHDIDDHWLLNQKFYVLEGYESKNNIKPIHSIPLSRLNSLINQRYLTWLDIAMLLHTILRLIGLTSQLALRLYYFIALLSLGWDLQRAFIHNRTRFDQVGDLIFRGPFYTFHLRLGGMALWLFKMSFAITLLPLFWPVAPSLSNLQHALLVSVVQYCITTLVAVSESEQLMRQYYQAVDTNAYQYGIESRLSLDEMRSHSHQIAYGWLIVWKFLSSLEYSYHSLRHTMGLAETTVDGLLQHHATNGDEHLIGYEPTIAAVVKRQHTPRHIRENAETEAWLQHVTHDSCSICLVEFEYQDECIVLPCKHILHDGCLKQWVLNQKGACPMCLSLIRPTAKKKDSSTSIAQQTQQLDEYRTKIYTKVTKWLTRAPVLLNDTSNDNDGVVVGDDQPLEQQQQDDDEQKQQQNNNNNNNTQHTPVTPLPPPGVIIPSIPSHIEELYDYFEKYHQYLSPKKIATTIVKMFDTQPPSAIQSNPRPKIDMGVLKSNFSYYFLQEYQALFHHFNDTFSQPLFNTNESAQADHQTQTQDIADMMNGVRVGGGTNNNNSTTNDNQNNVSSRPSSSSSSSFSTTWDDNVLTKMLKQFASVFLLKHGLHPSQKRPECWHQVHLMMVQIADDLIIETQQKLHQDDEELIDVLPPQPPVQLPSSNNVDIPQYQNVVNEEQFDDGDDDDEQDDTVTRRRVI